MYLCCEKLNIFIIIEEDFAVYTSVHIAKIITIICSSIIAQFKIHGRDNRNKTKNLFDTNIFTSPCTCIKFIMLNLKSKKH